MQVACNRKAFRQALLTATRVLAKNSTLPIVGSLKLEADPARGYLILYSTNLDQFLQVTMRARIQQGGSIAIKPRTLLKWLKHCPAPNVEFEDHEGPGSVPAEQAQFTCGDSKALFYLMDVEEWPLILEQKPEDMLTYSSISVRDLRRAWRVVYPATTTDNSRPSMTHIQLEVKKDSVRWGAADGFRLVRIRTEATSSLGREENPRLSIGREVVRKLLPELRRSRPNVVIRTYREASAGTPRITVQLLGNEQDPITEILSTSIMYSSKIVALASVIEGIGSQFRATANRADLLGAIYQMRALGSGSSAFPLVMKLPDEKTIELQSPMDQIGEWGVSGGFAKVKATVEDHGHTVGFNSNYLADILSMLPDKQIKLWGENRSRPVGIGIPGVSTDDFIAIVMPIHLRDPRRSRR